jgi:WD40 repeat protein
VNDTKSLFVADDEGFIHLYDLHQLLATGSFHALHQRSSANASELRVRKHSVTPRLPAKYPRDASWSSDIPKWLARAPPPHCVDFFTRVTPPVHALEWRAHSSTVQSLSLCCTDASQQPALLSSGDDGHVRLWDLSGACLGSLAQVRGTVLVF